MNISLPCFAIFATFATLFAGCASTQNTKTNWLSGYEKTALVRVKSNENVFLTSRRPHGSAGTVIVGNNFGQAAGTGLLTGLLESATHMQWAKSRTEFNRRIGRDLKPELSSAFFKRLSAGFAERNVANEIVEVDATTVTAAVEGAKPNADALVAAVKSRCAKCDAMLIIDDGYGFEKRADRGWRAQAEATALLMSIADQAVKHRANVSYLDLTGKYDYVLESEVLKDATNAATFLPALIEPFAKTTTATVLR